jgi:hypothetical protein
MPEKELINLLKYLIPASAETDFCKKILTI